MPKLSAKALEEATESMRDDISSGECAIVYDNGSIYYCRKLFGRISDTPAPNNYPTLRKALRALKEHMAKHNFFPNIYRVNERGNTALLQPTTGREICSWV